MSLISSPPMQSSELSSPEAVLATSLSALLMPPSIGTAAVLSDAVGVQQRLNIEICELIESLKDTSNITMSHQRQIDQYTSRLKQAKVRADNVNKALVVIRSRLAAVHNKLVSKTEAIRGSNKTLKEEVLAGGRQEKCEKESGEREKESGERENESGEREKESGEREKESGECEKENSSTDGMKKDDEENLKSIDSPNSRSIQEEEDVVMTDTFQMADTDTSHNDTHNNIDSNTPLEESDVSEGTNDKEIVTPDDGKNETL